LDGQIWALKSDSLTSPLIVTVTVTETSNGVKTQVWRVTKGSNLSCQRSLGTKM